MGTTGRVFVLDNYYTTVALAVDFLEKGQYILGTMKRQRVPQCVKEKDTPAGDYDWTNVTIENKKITFLRIFHRQLTGNIKKLFI